ncbi:centrosomal protein of isoform C [Alligator mississippiensis]|uniref:Centrosomal protein of isoform C n=1 Tax=Alligator mississippiensis TaxID=8496 RepID=A0A151MH37_ALLMI|nr:centrosomal protein of isoform C [Alligator mississippiensis]
MIFVGRDDCELMLQSRSVDKQHAVLNYDASTDEHLVKDLGSLNGTFVNDVRIPEQTYITLKLDDKLRFGYDTNLFTVVRGEMRVPEEALKHEKFTSQLQLSQKSSEIEGSKSISSKGTEPKVSGDMTEMHHKATEALKSEEKSMDLSAMPRGTPLYGQPSWWGDDEADEKNGCKQEGKREEKIHETGASGCSTDTKQVEEHSASANEELYPFCREPSYFEIPTKEFQQTSQIEESTIHEIPTKDTQSSHAAGAGHASFTIEFDDNTPGKVTIKDHVTKFTSDQRHKPKKSSSGGQDLPGLQTVMMAAESKVADWLAQNNPPRMIWEPTEEDSKSIKSDVPVYLKRLKGNKHDDGTQSDSENVGAHRHYSKRATLEEHLRHHHAEQKSLHQKVHSAEKHQEQATDNDDDQSDKGTYTIELENPNSEEVEARKMIDKVFGVDDSQDYNRPVVNENQKDLVKDWAINSATVVLEEKRPLSTTGFLDTEESCTASGNKRWVSQWASLAANHTRHDQDDLRLEPSASGPLENDTDISESGISVKSTGSATSVTSQDSKSKPLTSAHNSPTVNSRWRRFPTDYASTSEDEFGSNRNSPKHTRLRTSPALKTTRLQSTGTATQSSNTFKHRIKEQEDYIRDWTAHREEIARISQDLALIAREINDVAGEIDSVTSSGTAPSTTVSTAATTPGSAIDTREELVDRVFDESLNFRKIPPLVHAKPPEGNGRSNDSKPQLTEAHDPPTITRRRTWSRDEVMGDSLLLSSVFQFSRKIRQSIDKTAGKIRILFKDKDRNWEEIENKLRAEGEIPIVKTSSMEISSILQELKRVEKQLQVINAMIDPDGTLDALSNLGFTSPVLPAVPKQKSSPASHPTRPQIQPNCQPEARALRPAANSISTEFDNVEPEPDFSIHFNRFNPDGEEEDPTVHE